MLGVFLSPSLVACVCRFPSLFVRLPFDCQWPQVAAVSGRLTQQKKPTNQPEQDNTNNKRHKKDRIDYLLPPGVACVLLVACWCVGEVFLSCSQASDSASASRAVNAGESAAHKRKVEKTPTKPQGYGRVVQCHQQHACGVSVCE